MKIKRIAAVALTATTLLGGTNLANVVPAQTVKAAEASSQTQKDSRPRAIITTDLECDDMNSLIHTSLFFNDIDIDGIVYSASQFHFTGDGVHTLAEVNPNFCCSGFNGESREEIEQLKVYRPMELGWIENLWSKEYASVYPMLKENDNRYPSPEYLNSITKVGNVEFEGDVRFDTEGSNLIKQAILDDDERPLYLFTWGGFNTIARALISIHDDYKNDEDAWQAVRQKIYDKVVISGYTQDFSFRDHIYELYPDLKLLSCSDAYPGYFASTNAPADARYTFQADWLKENIKFNHGALLGKYGLMGDGTYYEGEPDINQYGLTTTIDWSGTGIPLVVHMNQYDFLGEGDSTGLMSLINVGLRGMEPGNGQCGTYSGKISYEDKPNLSDFNSMMAQTSSETTNFDVISGAGSNSTHEYLLDYQNEWAARADWCIKHYSQANHAPNVTLEKYDFTATAGEVIPLKAHISDSDNDNCNELWTTDAYSNHYSGDAKNLKVWNMTSADTYFTVPTDAKSGDTFILTLKVTDDATKPMSRFAQAIVYVK